MTNQRSIALAATRSIRSSEGYRRLGPGERADLNRDLLRIERALGDSPNARAMATPASPLAPPGQRPAPPAETPPQPAGAAAPQPKPSALDAMGDRTARTLEAIDFPSFVAGLIDGTFQAIVDSTVQQVREYARLVASLSQSLDEFTRDNVSPDQARDMLAERHPHDLRLVLPPPGEAGRPRLLPRRDDGDSPDWLRKYDLEGEPLTEDLTEGPLLRAAERRVGEERMQSLATLVLMGVNRIVVNDGTLRAKLQFHARASEKTTADVGFQGSGIAGRQGGGAAQMQTMVSTVDVNAQTASSIKADLVGEVAVNFSTQTFDLARFADSRAIELINQHAYTRETNAQPEPEPGAGTDGER